MKKDFSKMSLCVCVHICVHTHVHKMYLYRSIQAFVLSYETQISLLALWAPSHTILHHFSVDMELIVWLRWPANEQQVLPCFFPPKHRIFKWTLLCPNITWEMGMEILLNTHACTASPLCIGSSLCSSLKC